MFLDQVEKPTYTPAAGVPSFQVIAPSSTRSPPAEVENHRAPKIDAPTERDLQRHRGRRQEDGPGKRPNWAWVVLEVNDHTTSRERVFEKLTVVAAGRIRTSRTFCLLSAIRAPVASLRHSGRHVRGVDQPTADPPTRREAGIRFEARPLIGIHRSRRIVGYPSGRIMLDP